MSDGKWSDGPWSVHPLGGFRDVNGHRVEHSSCWIEGAWCGEDARSQSKANDALIAAAPVLAEAVRDMLEHEPSREDFRAGRKGDLQFKIATQVWGRARAALSRAKGEGQ